NSVVTNDAGNQGTIEQIEGTKVGGTGIDTYLKAIVLRPDRRRLGGIENLNLPHWTGNARCRHNRLHSATMLPLRGLVVGCDSNRTWSLRRFARIAKPKKFMLQRCFPLIMMN